MEAWRNLEFMGYSRYEVSTYGKIRSVDYRNTGATKELTPRKNDDGYLYINITDDANRKKKTFKIHRLVASAFINNNNEYGEINHKDEDKTNNNIDNLEWCDRKYNNNYNKLNKRKNNSNNKFKKLEQTNINTGEINIFENAKCLADFGFRPHSIYNSCKTGKAYKGYKWRYI